MTDSPAASGDDATATTTHPDTSRPSLTALLKKGILIIEFFERLTFFPQLTLSPGSKWDPPNHCGYLCIWIRTCGRFGQRVGFGGQNCHTCYDAGTEVIGFDDDGSGAAAADDGTDVMGLLD